MRNEQGLTRRRIVQGAAWTIPVLAVATATPLAAASQCTAAAGSLIWVNNYTRESATSGSGSAPVNGGAPIPFTVTGQFAAGVQQDANTFTVSGTTGDGPGLTLTTFALTASGSNMNPNNAYNLTVTITVERPVENVRFRVWDVDTNDAPQAPFREYVRVPTAGAVPTLGANLGIFTGGWIGATSVRNAPNSDSGNAIAYVIPGPLSSFQLIMSRPVQNGGGDGGVIVGNIQFDEPC